MSRPTAGVLGDAGLSTLRQASPANLAATLGTALRELSADALPAALCCDRGGVIQHPGWSIRVRDTRHHDGRVEARIELFFSEVVGGCSCHDDPTVHDEFRTLGLTVDCATGALAWALE